MQVQSEPMTVALKCIGIWQNIALCAHIVIALGTELAAMLTGRNGNGCSVLGFYINWPRTGR